MHRPLSARLSFTPLSDLSSLLKDLRGRKKYLTLDSPAIVVERANELETRQKKDKSMLPCQICSQAATLSEIMLASRYFLSFCDSCDVQDIQENLQFAGIRNSRLDQFL
jgi:hypothetical protein